VGAGWRTARGADDVALLSEKITVARVTALRHAVAAAARSARPVPVAV